MISSRYDPIYDSDSLLSIDAAVFVAKKEQYPSDAADKFLLRLPDGMRDEVAKAAAANGRSMNAEIVARLQETFRGRDLSAAPADLRASVQRMEKELKTL